MTRSISTLAWAAFREYTPSSSRWKVSWCPPSGLHLAALEDGPWLREEFHLVMKVGASSAIKGLMMGSDVIMIANGGSSILQRKGLDTVKEGSRKSTCTSDLSRRHPTTGILVTSWRLAEHPLNKWAGHRAELTKILGRRSSTRISYYWAGFSTSRPLA